MSYERFCDLMEIWLNYHWPILLFYVIEIPVALLLLRNYPKPRRLAFYGLMVLFLNEIMGGFVMCELMCEGVWFPNCLNPMNFFLKYHVGVFDTIGLGLLVAAIFVGRSRKICDVES